MSRLRLRDNRRHNTFRFHRGNSRLRGSVASSRKYVNIGTRELRIDKRLLANVAREESVHTTRLSRCCDDDDDAGGRRSSDSKRISGLGQSRGCVATIRSLLDTVAGALCQLKVRVLKVGRRFESVRINRGRKARVGDARPPRVRPLFASFVLFLPFSFLPARLFTHVCMCACVQGVPENSRVFSESGGIQLK